MGHWPSGRIKCITMLQCGLIFLIKRKKSFWVFFYKRLKYYTPHCMTVSYWMLRNVASHSCALCTWLHTQILLTCCVSPHCFCVLVLQHRFNTEVHYEVVRILTLQIHSFRKCKYCSNVLNYISHTVCIYYKIVCRIFANSLQQTILLPKAALIIG